MNSSEQSGKVVQAIRLVFELDREEDPRLYDDLIRFNKGTRRVNRLRILAHDGMLAQQRPTEPVQLLANPNGAAAIPAIAPPDKEDGAIINQIFDEPIQE